MIFNYVFFNNYFFSTVFYTDMPVSFWPSLGSLSHFRMCVEENAVAVVSEIHALVSENSTEGDIIIFTDGFVIYNLQHIWTLMAQCLQRIIKVKSDVFFFFFAATTSSMTMWIMIVIKVMIWLRVHMSAFLVIR